MITPSLADSASSIYSNDPNALKLARDLRLPTGEYIDYVLVYVTKSKAVRH